MAYAARRLPGDVLLVTPPVASVVAILSISAICASAAVAARLPHVDRIQAQGWLVPCGVAVRASSDGDLCAEVFVRSGDLKRLGPGQVIRLRQDGAAPGAEVQWAKVRSVSETVEPPTDLGGVRFPLTGPYFRVVSGPLRIAGDRGPADRGRAGMTVQAQIETARTSVLDWALQRLFGLSARA